jgi:hypothetical protein
VEEVAERVQIGTQLLNKASAQPGEELPAAPLPLQDGDGTLLAIVPIPGTRTSLAIVGYPVTAPGVKDGASPVVPDGRTGLLLDHDQRRVWVDGKEVPLTFQEFELLAFLSAHPSTVFTRADLVRQVWQRDFAADSRTVDVHISRLRHKLGASYGKYLVTEYRVGYQFRPPVG